MSKLRLASTAPEKLALGFWIIAAVGFLAWVLLG